AATPDDFFRRLFAGETMLENITAKYLPARFPVTYGSILSSAALGLPDPCDLGQVALRYSKALDALFMGFRDPIRDAAGFDFIFAIKAPATQFDFAYSLKNQFQFERFSSEVFADS